MSDCWQTLEVLEAVELGGLPATDRLAIDARAHHDSCPQCQQTWTTRRLWSHRLAAAMVDLPVPVTMPAVVPQPRATHRPRSRWLTAGAILALLLVASAGLWFVWPTPPDAALDRQTVALHIAENLAQFRGFSGSFEPQLPTSWRSAFQSSRSLVRGFPAGSQRAAALIPFQFTLRQGSESIRGRLIIVPRAQFTDPPSGQDFATAEVFYARDGGVWCLWSEGDLVYICFVRSGVHDLQRLQQALDRPRSLT